MKIDYNATGERRKMLVKAISQELGTPSRYLGMPTAAYEINIGINSVITVDRNGTVWGAIDRELITKLRDIHGFTAESVEHDAPPQTDTTTRPADNADTLNIEIPRDDFTPKTLSNIRNIVESKETLIKKALGIDDLPIVETENTVQFPWFSVDLRETVPEKITAYTSFIAALCHTAKNQIRATPIEKESKNNKYDFRVFLLKLGLIGEEHRATRKILLANLSGDSSFKDKEHRRYKRGEVDTKKN